MTLLAGAYSRRATDAVPVQLCEAIQRALSRHPSEDIEVFRDTRCFLAKADTGAFGDKATRIGPEAVSFMAGEPLLSHDDRKPRRRSADLVELHDAWTRDHWEPLTRARGVFSAVHYRPESGTLVLLTDKLGIRPIYVWLGDHYVVFASALRILEQVPFVPKVMDVRAVTEISSIGFALGRRTPFASIALLKPAEIVRVDGEVSSRRSYWRWNDIPISDRPVSEIAGEAYRSFKDAVALRNRGDSTAVAFLSGGLDSRAIVMALRDLGVDVHTYNFSISGAQDAEFGAEFARQAGTMHRQLPANLEQQLALTMADAWQAAPSGMAPAPERPRIVWSGDGGSVGVGHVYLNRAIVEMARSGNVEAAAELLTRVWGGDVPRRLLRPAVLKALEGTARTGLLEELTDLRSADVGRSLHLVLMYNDQHRHLAKFFETIDLHRIEYQLPFFDSEFLASVLSVPVDASLGHGFYMQWLKHFPPATLSVPWQSYPGHAPCPLPVPKGLTLQWGKEQQRIISDMRRRDIKRQATQMLRARDFPHPLLKRHTLRAAAWLHRLRLRDVGYLVRAAHPYYRYWSQSGGKYVLATSNPPAAAEPPRVTDSPLGPAATAPPR